MKPIYNVLQCNRCLDMEYSYFDNCVHRYCKAYDCILTGMSDLQKSIHCNRFNRGKKGSKKKSTFLKKEEYLGKYPE